MIGSCSAGGLPSACSSFFLMKYEKIDQAKFIERENRFVARVELPKAGTGLPVTDGKGAVVRVHVKNTGRCRELLVPDATVYLEDFDGRMGSRRMRYSLVAVEKQVGSGAGGGTGEKTILINMDSQAPNKVVQEALADGRICLPGMNDEGDRFTLIKPETKYGDSRFDFYVETVSEAGKAPKRAFIEVKGVTLEENGHARFPDAPTERGVKHINELIRARQEGYGAYIIFIVQMEGMKDVAPNYETHPEFGETLAKASRSGVVILAYDCRVTPGSLTVKEPVRFVF